MEPTSGNLGSSSARLHPRVDAVVNRGQRASPPGLPFQSAGISICLSIHPSMYRYVSIYNVYVCIDVLYYVIYIYIYIYIYNIGVYRYIDIQICLWICRVCRVCRDHPRLVHIHRHIYIHTYTYQHTCKHTCQGLDVGADAAVEVHTYTYKHTCKHTCQGLQGLQGLGFGVLGLEIRD